MNLTETEYILFKPIYPFYLNFIITDFFHGEFYLEICNHHNHRHLLLDRVCLQSRSIVAELRLIENAFECGRYPFFTCRVLNVVLDLEKVVFFHTVFCFHF